MKITLKPHNFLLIAAILVIVISFFVSTQTVDINFVDAYYIVNFTSFLRIIAIFLLFFSLIYKFLQRNLAYQSLSWVHIISSILLIAIFIWVNYNFNKSLALIETTTQGSTNYYSENSLTINRIAFAFILIQILPILNLSIGLMKRNKKK